MIPLFKKMKPEPRYEPTDIIQENSRLHLHDKAICMI